LPLLTTPFAVLPGVTVGVEAVSFFKSGLLAGLATFCTTTGATGLLT